MKLQTKTILCFDAAIISVCILLSLLGYRAANNGFEAALEEKAHSDLHQAKTLLELYYPGPWYLKNGLLFKGEKQMDGAFDVVDHLSKMNGNNVTIFNGDTRVATTFPRENADSSEKPTGGHPVSGSIEPSSKTRAVGTKASEEVTHTVLEGGSYFRGEAQVLGKKYFCVYAPIEDPSGNRVGMLFMGIPKESVDILQSSFLKSTVTLTIVLALAISILMFLWLRHFITQPILRLKQSAESFVERSRAQSDLEVLHFEDPDIHTHDELEDLATSLTTMCDNMKKYAKKLMLADKKVDTLKETILKMDTLVYQDALTGVGNKAAYENIMAHMDWDILAQRADFAIVMTDLNYLKRINDTFGHEQGNSYIIGLCNLLKSFFPNALIFRIGGDEFVSFLQGEDIATCHDAVQMLKQKMTDLQDSNLEPWEKISAAVGMAIYDPAKHTNAHDVFNEADEKMYSNKRAMKAGRE